MFSISNQLVNHLEKLGRLYLPRESCALLVGMNNKVLSYIWIENIAESNNEFVMDPNSMGPLLFGTDIMIKDYFALQYIGIWHTHPFFPAIPSTIDNKYAKEWGRTSLWIITSYKNKIITKGYLYKDNIWKDEF